MRRRALPLLAAVALAGACATAGEPPLTPADEAYGAAGALFARGQFPRAAGAYAAFARRHRTDPRAPEAAFRSAESLYRAGEGREARAAFERCLKLKLPAARLAAARLRLGAISYAAGEHQKAAEMLGRADLKALPVEARRAGEYFLGTALLELGKKKEAAAHFKAASASKQPAVAAPALLALARLAGEAGRREEASRHLEALLKRFPAAPQAPEAHFRMAELLRTGGGADKALPLYQAVLERVEPGGLAGRAALGAAWCCLQKEDAPGALKMAGLAARVPALKVESLYVTGMAQMAARKYADAEKAFDQLTRLEPKGERAERAACRAVWCAHLAGRGAEAGNRAREFRARFPQSRLAPEVAYVEGLAAAAGGDLEGALKALDAVAADPKGERAAEAAYGAAALCSGKGREEEARGRLERLVRQHPRHGLSDPALLRLGEMALAAADAKAAARHFERHLSAFPASPRRPAALLGRALAAAAASDWRNFAKRCGELSAAHPKTAQGAEAQYWLAWNHERLKSYDRAIAAYNELIRKHRRSPLIYEFKFRLSCACYLNGNYPRAAEGFLALARAGKRKLPAEALLWLGEHLGSQKRAGEAAEIYALAAASRDPGTRGEAYLALGHQALAEGHPGRAAEHYRKLLAEGAGRARAEEARLGLARALRLGGKLKEARAAAAELVASRSERTRLAARGELALVSLAAGNAPAARESLTALATLYDDPELVPGWLAALAAAEEKLGGKEAATAWHRELIKRYPASPEARAASKKTGIPLPETGEKPGTEF